MTSKKASRWSRLGGGSSSSSSSISQDFYSTDSSAMALTRDPEIEQQVDGLRIEDEKNEASNKSSPATSLQPSPSPLARSNSKPNRGLVGRLRKMANTNKNQSDNEASKGEFESSNHHLAGATSNGRLNNYSVHREDTPLSATQQDQASSSGNVNFPRESSNPSSPIEGTSIPTHRRTESRASLSSVSSNLLFGHFASSIASSSDHGSIRSGDGSDEGEGGADSLPNLGSMDFNLASDFSVADSSASHHEGGDPNGKGKGKEKAVLRGQLPPSVAMALKDSGKERTPRLVYGDGGARRIEHVEAIPSSPRQSEKRSERIDESRGSALIPSPIDDSKSIASLESVNHSRIRSLEPSLIGFSMEDDENEDGAETTELEEKLEGISSTRQRRDSGDSSGTIKDAITPSARDEEIEDGDESMPGSFFFNPPVKASKQNQSTQESSLVSSPRAEPESPSPSWDGGEESSHSPIGEYETMEETAGEPDGNGYAAIVGASAASREVAGTGLEDQFSTIHSAEPSDAYHSLEPSLDDSLSTLTHSANFDMIDLDAHASNLSSSSGSFRTLSAEDLRSGLMNQDTSRRGNAPYVSRRTTYRKSVMISESQGAIPVSQRWLNGNSALGESSPEKKHYLIKEMVRKELIWELDRAWLLNLDQDRTSTQNSDEDEFSVFQSSNDDSETRAPSLPLLEFLFEHIFASFPLFKASQRDSNGSGFTPKDYLKESILPLLAARQKSSLSSRVDRLGEGDGTPFSARTTLDGVKAILQKWIINYVTSVLKVDTNQRDLSSALQDGKRSLGWPSPNLLPPEAFLACRKPNLNSLRHGGMEVTFDSMRVRRGENGFFAVDYMLCIKRPNKRSRFVVRNEADFEQFALSISKELGKDSKVRSLPPRGAYSESDEEFEEASDPNSNTKSSTLTSVLANKLILGKGSTNFNTLSNKSSTTLGRQASFGKSTSTLARRRSRSNSASTSVPTLQNKSSRQFGSTGRSSRLRKFSSVQPPEAGNNFGFGEGSDSENFDRSLIPNQFSSSRRGLPISSAPSTPSLDESKKIDFNLSGQGNGSEGGGSKSQRSSMDVAPKFNFGSLNFGNRSKISLKSKASQGKFGRSTSSLVGPGQNGEDSKDNGGGSGRSSQDSKRQKQASQPLQSNPNLPDLPNKRRRRLRAWLRDTLSIRGAVDSREAKDFLSIGSFAAEDLKPSDVSAMNAVKQYDERRRAQREEDEKIAGEEILGLRETIDRVWDDCKLGDGFPKILWAVQRAPTFTSLPVHYQQILSYGNLQLARFLHGTFVASNVSRGNLARARELFSNIPWSMISLAFREPTGKMLEMIQDSILKPASIQNLLSVLLEDNEATSLEQQLCELKNQIHSGMMKKIERFVESDDQMKRIVRDHAEKSGIPLVAAIVRSAEEPRLSDSEMEQVIVASRKYGEFMASQPSVVRQRANKTREYLLISRLQRALRLLSLQRDGSQIRSAMQDPTIASCLANLFSPLNEILTGLHGIEGVSSSVSHLQRFLKRVLDLLSALRARVLDPAQALNEIATLLDQGTIGWYEFLHRASLSNSSKGGVESLVDWLVDLTSLSSSGSLDLAQIWPRNQQVPLEKIVSNSEALLSFAKRKRNRQMELACRWVAGQTDSDLSIQVHGDGLGFGRIHPFFPREPRPLSQKDVDALDSLRVDFARACKVALEKLAEK